MSDAALTQAEAADFSRLAAFMIPASEEYGVPGADDPAIFADIVRSLGPDLTDVKTALAELDALAGATFAELPPGRASAVAEAFLAAPSPAALVLGRVILQCYYRDDRVLLSLGVEPRAPYPKGHEVEQGDWSLLAVVHGKKPFWRDDRGT